MKTEAALRRRHASAVSSRRRRPNWTIPRLITEIEARGRRDWQITSKPLRKKTPLAAAWAGALPPRPIESAAIRKRRPFDNFPKGPIPDGWTKRPRVDGTGYDLVSLNGAILFGYRAASYLVAGLQKESLIGLVDCEYLCGRRRSCCRKLIRSIRTSPASSYNRAWGDLLCVIGLSECSRRCRNFT
jgi:hypothetical protein